MTLKLLSQWTASAALERHGDSREVRYAKAFSIAAKQHRFCVARVIFLIAYALLEPLLPSRQVPERR